MDGQVVLSLKAGMTKFSVSGIHHRDILGSLMRNLTVTRTRLALELELDRTVWSVGVCERGVGVIPQATYYIWAFTTTKAHTAQKRLQI